MMERRREGELYLFIYFGAVVTPTWIRGVILEELRIGRRESPI